MRRGLKLKVSQAPTGVFPTCLKEFPDEKGIETSAAEIFEFSKGSV
jgi:hypothetical protein